MYQHSQPGTLIRVLMVIVILGQIILGWLIWKGMIEPHGLPEEARTGVVIYVLGIFVILGVLALFHNLTVRVDGEALRAIYGVGLIRKTVLLAELESCEPVNNSWWMGWGIRKIPGGWMYNVSGMKAVELKLKKGGLLRIGTDEPEVLAGVIKDRIAALG